MNRIVYGFGHHLMLDLYGCDKGLSIKKKLLDKKIGNEPRMNIAYSKKLRIADRTSL